MAGFTIRCNDCENELVTSEEHRAVNGKVDVELVCNDEDENIGSLVFCMKCDNSTVFQ